LSAFYLFSKRKQYLDLYISLTFGVTLLTFQFFFQVFHHYYMLILPLVIAGFAIIFSNVRCSLRAVLVLLISFSVLSSGKMITVYMLSVISKNPYKEQQNVANDISKYMQDEKTLYCLGVPAQKFYLLMDKKPVLLEKYGYSFGPADTETNILERLEAADCLVLDKYLFIPEHLVYSGYTAFTEKVTAEINNFNKVYETDRIAFYIREEK